MTQETTIDEMNSAIAIFMGYERYEDEDGIWFKKDGLVLKLEDLKYHSDWSELQEVFEKIETGHPWASYIGRDIYIKADQTISSGLVVYLERERGESRIAFFHRGAYGFTQWYNTGIKYRSKRRGEDLQYDK